MRRKLAVAVAALVALAAATLAVLALVPGEREAVLVDRMHGTVVLREGEQARILAAADVVARTAAQDDLAADGRLLFRDSNLTEDGESCQTCHTEGSASATLGTIPHTQDAGQPNGPDNFDGPRDPPALWGLERTAPYFWNGDVPTLRAALVRPVKGHFEEFVSGACSGAAATSQACVDKAGAFAARLEAFVRTLDAPLTSFDQGTLSAAALRGERLFQTKAGCIECHGGPLFTDNRVHNTGVPQLSFTTADGSTRTSNDRGAGAPPAAPECQVAAPPAGCEGVLPFPASAFVNTPQLRDLRNTAPYMHNGAVKTLRDVVLFYDRGSAVSPLNLTDPEIDDLVAFLAAL